MSLVSSRAVDPLVTQPLDAVLSRISVSQLQEPAPDGRPLDLILRAAMRAPDHGRLRPWRLILVRGTARTDLADVVETALRRRNPDVTEEMVQRQRAKLAKAPLIIALGVHIRPESNIPEFEQVLSVGAAAMNMLNAIHLLGFGGVWVTGPNAYDLGVAAALGLQPPDRLAGFLFVGTPREEVRAPQRPDPGGYTTEWAGKKEDTLRA